MAIKGKHKLELNAPGDGRIFLNYWDSEHAKDVCCEVIDGKLMHLYYEDDQPTSIEISLTDFLTMIEQSIAKM